ncbi:hypothetical protein N8I77_010797 [Diaporthe amygdali]|uniref:Nephrocystin 3-like N-terminal domain-containing protein n=1 Tax=Phomopsis amygdali TaxID=1214568 RepID=A0AAD9S8T7_PHOAM|nr:hypothetical protein N8I77_010797 [Diaporthe amygdali]
MLTKAFAFQSANTKLLSALEKNSEILDRISTDFFQTLETYNNLNIASFSEEKQVRFGVLGMQIVKADSAKIGHAREVWGSISEDHRNIAKYSTLRDDGFVKVSRKIKDWVSDIQRQMSGSRLIIFIECLNSLDDPVARFRVQEVDPVRHISKNTFEWLFTEQVPFARWLADDNEIFDAIFWITGKPGSGKSTLMRFALEDPRIESLQPQRSKGHPIAYFFHLRGRSLIQKSLRGMLMELVYQVLGQYPRSFQLIQPIFLNLKRQGQPWDVASLSQAILQIPNIPPAMSGCRDRITFFIDALDETQNQDDNSALLSIFDDLLASHRSVRGSSEAPVLKICLASRPWPIFRKRLGDDPRVPSFAIHDFTRTDIQDYTDSRLLRTTHSLKAFVGRQMAVSQLSTDIASRAKGVFIWVRVVVDNLRPHIIDGTSIQELQNIVHEYPEELDDMYRFTLTRVREPYRPETQIILKAVLASRVPLTVQQLYTVSHICMGSPDFKKGLSESAADTISWLASRSGGLIDIVNTGVNEHYSPTPGETADESVPDPLARANLHVEYIHQTVQDFVRNTLDRGLPMAQTKTQVAQVSGSRLLAFACLDSHPPNPHLSNIAKDVFSYIREVEREDDETNRRQISRLPHWGSFDLHDFPFRVRRSQDPSGSVDTTPRTFYDYLDMNDRVSRKLVFTEEHTEAAYDGPIPEHMHPFVVAILHNLYHTRGPDYFLTLPTRSFNSVGIDQRLGRLLLLFMASSGPTTDVPVRT